MRTRNVLMKYINEVLFGPARAFLDSVSHNSLRNESCASDPENLELMIEQCCLGSGTAS